jgi:hypothetical protein
MKGCTASMQITGVDQGGKNKSQIQYKVLLHQIDGSLAEFRPYGVNQITSDAVRLDLLKAKDLFPICGSRWRAYKG